MKRLLYWLGEVIWPRRLKCLCCEEYSRGKLLCPTCVKALAAMRILEELEGSSAKSTYRYDGVAKQLVLLLKEDCVADAAQPLAAGMAELVREMELPADTVLTWVTMPPRRLKKRGFDHGRALCSALAEATGFPFRQLLYRVGEPHTQRGLSRERRMMNLNGTIRCGERLNMPVLVVDDVMTTGATASLCMQELIKAGATQVYVITATLASRHVYGTASVMTKIIGAERLI